ncbi:MAG: SpoIID/LytB domain-containing protein [Candidatus Omnitrophica bacterium]|nr:SpoIID/LytB domain-containing protein [Candidatus Omnitrophota bacterium]MBU1997320.1 SpoIID/LytB domain-containing protein [Candidatus Omnitrophota bacterium]MBU4334325.1 SpoIID/LytB domain-containing protein [Candidatus Omnitrophota bacterium]
MKRTVSFIVLLSVFIARVFFAYADLGDKRTVRIAVLKNVDDCVISIRGSYKIYDIVTGDLLVSSIKLEKSRVVVQDYGIHVGRRFYSTKKLRIKMQKDITIHSSKNKKRYRGEMVILANDEGKLILINDLDLELYVKGVLYHEVSHKWPLEAIKAQAVATRTYALYQTIVNKAQQFDVTSDIYSQVYGGRSAERFRTNIAAERTKKQILDYEGEVLPAYFHANCGGYTEDVSELWKHDLPPLKGVACTFCAKGPHNQWKTNFQLKAIQEKLNEKGHNVGLIKGIEILAKNRSGRIKTLKIETREGKSITISGKDFRNAVGPNDLKSNKYDLVMKGYYVDIVGRGWGHGVGMCQWGAYQMANEKYNYREILEHYYPGAKIVKY